MTKNIYRSWGWWLVGLLLLVLGSCWIIFRQTPTLSFELAGGDLLTVSLASDEQASASATLSATPTAEFSEVNLLAVVNQQSTSFTWQKTAELQYQFQFANQDDQVANQLTETLAAVFGSQIEVTTLPVAAVGSSFFSWPAALLMTLLWLAFIALTLFTHQKASFALNCFGLWLINLLLLTAAWILIVGAFSQTFYLVIVVNTLTLFICQFFFADQIQAQHAQYPTYQVSQLLTSLWWTQLPTWLFTLASLMITLLCFNIFLTSPLADLLTVLLLGIILGYLSTALIVAPLLSAQADFRKWRQRRQSGIITTSK